MKFNIIHIIICIFVFVGCTQQTVNNSVECFTIKESGSSLVYCSDTLKSKIQMEIIKGHYTVETKEVFAIVSNPKHLSLGYDSAWNLEKWENSQWIILDKKKHTNYFAELPFLAAYSDRLYYLNTVKVYHSLFGRFTSATNNKTAK